MATATQDAALAADPLLYRLPHFPAGIPITPNPAMSPCEAEGIAAWVTISGAAFPAMVMGGEPRVPVHLLLSRALFTQGVSEIQAMMDDLNIHKSIATHEQAERLRKMDAEVSCAHDMSTLNLMTRSDAERICGIVRIESNASPAEESFLDESDRLAVQHNVFGTVKGWVYPSRKGGRSVRCQECEYFFTPEDFIAHSHSDNKESQRTVHWGFDPSNWRLMLELAAPSSESSSCKERWKEFIDDPITQLCDTSEEREGFSANKAKRTFADLPIEVPAKVARCNHVMDVEKPVATTPQFSDTSEFIKMYIRDNLSRLFGPKHGDPLSLLGDVMQKESAFKVRSLASISAKSPSHGSLLSVDQQPNAVVPHPSAFTLVSENVNQLQSTCDRIESLESALKLGSSVDASVIDTLREIRTSLVEGSLAEYGRLRSAYEFLFMMYRQVSDPLGSIQDPMMQTAIANLRADHTLLGVIANSGPSLPMRTMADVSQQQAKLAQMSQFGNVTKAAAPSCVPSAASSSSDPQLGQRMLVQQLMQLLTTPQLSR